MINGSKYCFINKIVSFGYQKFNSILIYHTHSLCKVYAKKFIKNEKCGDNTTFFISLRHQIQ